MENSLQYLHMTFLKITHRRAETRALIGGGGGGDIHIFARRNSYEINPNNN